MLLLHLCPCSPSQIAMLLMEIEAGLSPCPTLKRILSAGEALTSSLARQAARVLPHVELVNAYGPTEATVYITHHTFDPREDNARPTVSIGKPLTNSKCYIVDKKNVSGAGLRTEGRMAAWACQESVAVARHCTSCSVKQLRMAALHDALQQLWPSITHRKLAFCALHDNVHKADSDAPVLCPVALMHFAPLPLSLYSTALCSPSPSCAAAVPRRRAW